MIIISLLLLGLFVGLISSFFGVGGGAFAVPVLFILFPDMPAQTVIGSSLGMIFLNNIINTYHFHRRGHSFQWKIIGMVSFAFLIGVTLSSRVAILIPSLTLKKFFGVFLLLIVIKNIYEYWRLEKKSAPQSYLAPRFQLSSWWRYSCIGALGGLVAGLTGLGGGIILVPLLAALLSMPYKLISPYSNLIMVIGSLAGTINYMFLPYLPDHPAAFPLQVGQVNWGVVLLIFVGATITSKIGVALNERCPEKAMRLIFIAMLLSFSCKILFFS